MTEVWHRFLSRAFEGAHIQFCAITLFPACAAALARLVPPPLSPDVGCIVAMGIDDPAASALQEIFECFLPRRTRGGQRRTGSDCSSSRQIWHRSGGESGMAGGQGAAH